MKRIAAIVVILIAAAIAYRQFCMNPNLVKAAGAGEIGKVKLLIRLGASLNARGEHGRTPLHEAARCGQCEVAEYLIQKGADINAKDDQGKGPLHMAAWQASESAVNLLLSNGADINAKDDDRSTPLHSAVRGGHKDVVELLVAKGADVNVKNKLGWTPMDGAETKEIQAILAGQGGAKATPYGLPKTPQPRPAQASAGVTPPAPVESGAPAKAPGTGSRGGITTIHAAAIKGRADMVNKFIEDGADVNEKGANGSTPLHMAACGGHKDIVQLLVAAGADVRATDNDKKTPLHWAASRGDEDIIRILLAKGANINAKDANGRTPLDWAAAYEQDSTADLLRSSQGRSGASPPQAGVDIGKGRVKVILKNGNEFEGALISEDDTEIVMNVNGAEMTFKKKTIQEFQKLGAKK